MRNLEVPKQLFIRYFENKQQNSYYILLLVLGVDGNQSSLMLQPTLSDPDERLGWTSKLEVKWTPIFLQKINI